ncbi:MAG: class I SAM-dependent methyltransferase [Nostochopsis sp.]
MKYCQDSRIIEYGCGTGSYIFSLAKNGAALVTGIDISSVAIELFKLPFLQKQAWQVLIKLSEPVKE